MKFEKNLEELKMTTYLRWFDLAHTGDHNSRGSHCWEARSCAHRVATCECGIPWFGIFFVWAPIISKISYFIDQIILRCPELKVSEIRQQ